MDIKYSKEFKERIVTEYLSGGKSYRELSKKCGVNFQQIQKWVSQFKDKHINNSRLALVYDECVTKSAFATHKTKPQNY